jgi:hypothetical protein
MVNHPFTNIGFDGLDHFYISDTTLCDKVCQWLATGQWFSQCSPVSSATI